MIINLKAHMSLFVVGIIFLKLVDLKNIRDGKYDQDSMLQIRNKFSSISDEKLIRIANYLVELSWNIDGKYYSFR